MAHSTFEYLIAVSSVALIAILAALFLAYKLENPSPKQDKKNQL